MSIFKRIIGLAFLVLLISGCELEDPIESTVTNYADFEVTGGQYIYWEQGEPFTDPGVIATAGGEELEVSVEGSVDPDTPGVYVISYSAVNEDGFPASTERYVAVGNLEVAAGRDLSGNYTPANTLTKILDGFYQASDLLPPNGIDGIIVDLGTGTLVMPLQSSPFGTAYADPSVDPDTFGTFISEDSFSIAMQVGSFGIFNRTFTK